MSVRFWIVTELLEICYCYGFATPVTNNVVDCLLARIVFLLKDS